MYTAKDICIACSVNRHQYDHARNVLFYMSQVPIGTGKAFQYTKEDVFKFKMFFLLNNTKIFRTKQIKTVLDKYSDKENYLLHERVLFFIDGLKNLIRK